MRPGAVVSTPYDHVSILATLATRFGIASLGPRMDAAADLSACIDPDRADGRVVGPDAAAARRALGLGAPRARRSGPTSQPELEALARAGGVPAHHVDPRSAEERMRAWLRRAQELEAVRVLG